jgi:formate dehydrogenase maturation protein FdhE
MNTIITEKKCTKCGRIKPIAEFYKRKRNKDGARSACNTCCALYGKAWRKKNSEKKRVANKKYRLEHLGEERVAQMKGRYGITPEEYDALLLGQDNVCAVCGRPPTNGKYLYVDHNHDTKEIRGLLCNNCNLMLGHAGDSRTTLQSAIIYLIKSDLQNEDLPLF